MGDLVSKVTGAVMGAIVGATSLVTGADASPENRYMPYEESGNTLGSTTSVLLASFNSVCKDGHLNPIVAAGLQARPDIGEPVAKLLLEVTDGKTVLPVDSTKMPYTASVIDGFKDKLHALLGQNEGLQSYVKQLADQPGADPYIRANLVSGALEFGCRQQGQIAGLVQDTFNAADKKKLQEEVTPLLNETFSLNNMLFSNHDQQWKGPALSTQP